jgi:hypothetical protein
VVKIYFELISRCCADPAKEGKGVLTANELGGEGIMPGCPQLATACLMQEALSEQLPAY